MLSKELMSHLNRAIKFRKQWEILTDYKEQRVILENIKQNPKSAIVYIKHHNRKLSWICERITEELSK